MIKGLAAAQVMVEEPGIPLVPALGHLGRDADGGFFLGIEIDVEMFGLQDLIVEFLILDLVPAEILAERRLQKEAQAEEERRQNEKSSGQSFMVKSGTHGHFSFRGTDDSPFPDLS